MQDLVSVLDNRYAHIKHILESLQSNNNILISFFKKFAYHEATFFLVRLLQQFTGFTLEKSENIQPPAEWASCDGLKGSEKVFPASHLTMYIKVSVLFLFLFKNCVSNFCELFFLLGWSLGPDGTVEDFGSMSLF